MGSFHHSRGRITFEVLCALAVSASLAGAWVQTGASALLAGAGAAALYGLVHAFDLKRRAPAMAEEPQAVEVEPQPTAKIEEAEIVEPAVSEARQAARPKAPRKSRARAPKKAKAVQMAMLDEPEAAAPPEPEVVELAPRGEPEVTTVPDEAAHAPVAPLFEAEPFVRQQRAVFGRKAG